MFDGVGKLLLVPCVCNIVFQWVCLNSTFLSDDVLMIMIWMLHWHRFD